MAIAYSKEQLEPRKWRKRYALDFRAGAVSGKKATSSYGSNISGLATVDLTLFCASDEENSVERLDFDEESKTFLRHRSYPLAGLFPRLKSDKQEADIEALAIDDDNYLWITGSHSLKRTVEDTAQSLDEFKKPKWDTKRALLGRVPIARGNDGRATLAASDGPRHSAMMDMGETEDDGLRALLKGDRLLNDFIGLASKENGFDIEGLAVSNNTVVLGLRGPVIASFAFLIVLSLTENGSGVLVPRPVDRPYRLQAIHLDGLGIRDLLFDGKNLLVLAGPTQKIESFQRIFVVDDFFASSEIITPNDRRLLMTLPMKGRGDHAEGIAFFTEKVRRRLLVGYDSPADKRWDEQNDRLIIDAFDLPD